MSSIRFCQIPRLHIVSRSHLAYPGGRLRTYCRLQLEFLSSSVGIQRISLQNRLSRETNYCFLPHCFQPLLQCLLGFSLWLLVRCSSEKSRIYIVPFGDNLFKNIKTPKLLSFLACFTCIQLYFYKDAVEFYTCVIAVVYFAIHSQSNSAYIDERLWRIVVHFWFKYLLWFRATLSYVKWCPTVNKKNSPSLDQSPMSRKRYV